MQEVQLALQRGVSREGGANILPVFLADADVPPLLRQFQWIDLRDGNVEKAVGQLVGAIKAGALGPVFRIVNGHAAPVRLGLGHERATLSGVSGCLASGCVG
jgi:hypothetical protein